MYPLFCAHTRQVTRCMHPLASHWPLGQAELAKHAQLIIFARPPEEKWVRENVIFRSVYDGQFHLCVI